MAAGVEPVAYQFGAHALPLLLREDGHGGKPHGRLRALRGIDAHRAEQNVSHHPALLKCYQRDDVLAGGT